MEVKHYTTITIPQKEVVVKMWNQNFPEKIMHPDLNSFDDFLSGKTDNHHYFIENENEEVVGWFYDFVRDDERWFSMIVSKTARGKGLGTKLLNAAKSNNNVLNGWVIDHDNDKLLDGSKYISPVAFYIKNGFKLIENERLDLPAISAVKMKWSS